MAIVTTQGAFPQESPENLPPEGPHRRSVLRRPTATTGFWGWLATVDHKKIGILYGISAFVFFLVGGVEALIIRTQLARPNGHVVSSQAYSQIFTMHGLTMIFLVVMPMGGAFFNYLLPLMIGARDVAIPPAERVQLLGVPVRRAVHLLVVPAGRRAELRVVLLRAACPPRPRPPPTTWTSMRSAC